MRRILLFILVLFPVYTVFGQRTPDFSLLNTERIHINETGMKVLGAWGGANILEGATGYALSKNEEWRSFHAMNAVWGVINLGIAGAGYRGARKEKSRQFSYSEALQQHEANRRLFLLNAGLDGIYIASGFFLTEHAKNEAHHPDTWRGVGKSFILQGTGLMLFDVMMYATHSHQHKRWYKVLQGVTISGNGIGWRYVL